MTSFDKSRDLGQSDLLKRRRAADADLAQCSAAAAAGWAGGGGGRLGRRRMVVTRQVSIDAHFECRVIS